MLKRIHVFYSGMVQGVGFRFTTENLAQKLGATGWVRNLHDSRVELIAEAEESILEDLVSRIEQYFQAYIHNVEIKWQQASGEFSNFGIRF